MRHPILGLVLGLSTFTAAFSQSLSDDQTAFLQDYSQTVYLDSLQTQAKWDFLSPHVKGKKLILIGEFNHGSKEIFELRNSLIAYLHQEMGANTILLESGIGELITADIDREFMSPSQMTNGLFGGWRTKEFVDLFSYAKSQDISIAGFDVQRTGVSFNPIFKKVMLDCKLDTSSIHDLESRYGAAARDLTNRKAVYDSLRDNTTKLMGDYQKVRADLAPFVTAEAPKELMLVDHTLENRIKYLSYMLQFLKDGDWSRRWAARDSAMANNTEWLLTKVYKDHPVILIGHNFHLGKCNENETVMGELLKDKYEKDMYSIGIFAGSGSYSDNSGKEVAMTPQDSTGLDIKHIITELEAAVTFLDMPEEFSPGSDWLNQDLIVSDTFIDLKNSNKMVLARTFDGLLLLKKVSPTKVDW